VVRILIAEDSPTVQRALISLLEDEPGIQIVGVVDNGEAAVASCQKLMPDLVTMDIFMPQMDGLEATRQIMKLCPTRIVIISSMVSSKDQHYSFQAVQAGAIEVLLKPQGLAGDSYDKVKRELVRILLDVMEAKPKKRFSWHSEAPWEAASQNAKNQQAEEASFVAKHSSIPPAPTTTEKKAISGYAAPAVVCIGGSTGAPAVLSDILTGLPGDYPIPILAVQHIVRGFAEGMASWLDSSVGMEVRIAQRGDKLAPGVCLLAPDDNHMRFSSMGRVELCSPKSNQLYVPSINELFSSAATVYGERALGIVLTGMGHDGTPGLLAMRQSGAATVAQNEKSSVVYGMPKVAVESGAVMEQLDPFEIVRLLIAFGEKV
jgi:two-component system, chemotaxis family, protein-glutamate methylesterase/glutaminase